MHDHAYTRSSAIDKLGTRTQTLAHPERSQNLTQHTGWLTFALPCLSLLCFLCSECLSWRLESLRFLPSAGPEAAAMCPPTSLAWTAEAAFKRPSFFCRTGKVCAHANFRKSDAQKGGYRLYLRGYIWQAQLDLLSESSVQDITCILKVT